MSLRGFHIVFITFSVLLASGFAFFEYVAFRQGHSVVDLLVFCLACLMGAGLLGYGVWFCKKSAKIIL